MKNLTSALAGLLLAIGIINLTYAAELPEHNKSEDQKLSHIIDLKSYEIIKIT